MFTENEVAIMLENDSIKESIVALKKEFVASEAKYLEINDHDFLSLILLTPSVGIALANGSVSLFEELSLNKKARKLSKGGYFLKKDPVVVAMGFMINHYDSWKDIFIDQLKKVMDIALDMDSIRKVDVGDDDISPDSFRREVLRAPYGFVRFLSSFFCAHDDEIINVEQRSIAKIEFECVRELGKALELDSIPIFRHFCATYTVK